MAPTPEQASLAADPSTDAHVLADLAHAEPELWPAIAAHPNAYPGLIEWMHEHGLPDESAIAAPSAAPGAAPQQQRPKALLSRAVTIALIAGATCISLAAFGLTGWTTYSAVMAKLGSAPAAGTAAVSSSATDYRFGATKTWETKVDVVAPGSEGFGGYYAKTQTYPGLWLVTWPGDASGSGRLSDETLLGMDPSTGAVKWSISPALLQCASTFTAGALVCVDVEKASVVVLDPSTGKVAKSALNGIKANSVDSFDGDIVLGYESPTGAGITDTVQRQKPNGTVVWTKSASCDGQLSDDGVQVVADGAVFADEVTPGAMHPGDTLIWSNCLEGIISLGNGAFNPDSGAGGDSCIGEGNPFQNIDSLFTYGYDVCSHPKYPMLITHGRSTVAAMTLEQFGESIGEQDVPTVWSADLSDADLANEPAWSGTLAKGAAHLGSYALLASSGHLYGLDTARGPRWEQPTAFSGDGHVVLLPVDWRKPNTPVLALETDSDTIIRLDPGAGAARVASEPSTLPACPKGQTPVSFSTWENGKGATLVCQGFARTVTVVVIVNGRTYTSASGSITPTGYRADFGGGVSVDIGLGGWATWVTDGQTTTLHTGSKGWQIGTTAAQRYPALSDKVKACPAGSYPLSLSTWHGGWLLTCGETATKITKFIYVDGSTHGSGNAMTEQGGLTCGTASGGVKVCVNASPAVVEFSSQGGTPTQHSVGANYVAGQRFGGAGQGTGAYGLADPKADAASEVAYLNGILQQSQVARASVRTVIQSIVRCTTTTADVQNAQAVVDDRTTELQALSSAPVDSIPGGPALLAQLQAVIGDSLQADRQYVTAANQVAGGQCAAGKATYATQKDFITQITNEKTTLANLWNSQIAPQYGTPTYTQDNI